MTDPFPRDYFYDRHGQPITYDEYSNLKYQTPGYRRIGSDQIGKSWVSTVWLGFDHGYSRTGPPIIFETMVFGGPMDGEVWRYSHEAEAAAGHLVVVELVRAMKPKHGQVKRERDQRRHEMKMRIRELAHGR